MSVEFGESDRKAVYQILYRNIHRLCRLPDPNPASPPDLPETPLYPLLHTNTPIPTMTYPGVPFPPNTSLYAGHEHVEWYHQDYAAQFNLIPNIRFNHTVLASTWVGNSAAGQWNITVRDHNETTVHKLYDHLVVASGHNYFPHVPSWHGQAVWLANSPPHGPRREILHSVWFREPERYVDRSVVVVGAGASGRDAASQIAPIARKVSSNQTNAHSLSN